MRPSALLFMYRRRLKAHLAQELFAGIGIAIAVALVFAAILAEGSISGSAGRVVHTVIGPAGLQLRARGSDGFGEATNARVKRLPGVRQAAPLLEQAATVTSANGRSVSVEVAGTDLRLAVLDGLAETLPIGSLSTNGIALSQAGAQALGLGRSAAKGTRVTVKLRGHAYTLPVSAVLGAEAAGALAGARVAVMPLSHLQKLAGLPGKVTRIFVQSKAGQRATVRTELTQLADGRLEVAPADADIALLRQALGPSDLASGLFASIGAVLGFLLAFNAMLLTVTERRRAIADLRIAGARRATIAEMVLFEALCLGIPASLLGLVAGYLLSRSVFHQSTNYLAEAFTLSGGTVVSTRAVLLSLLGGILATCLASAVPLLDLRRGRARDAIYEERGVPGSGLNRALRTRLAVAALCLVAGATALWTLVPAAAIPATALLALATVLAVPIAFAAVLRGADALGERLQRISILPLALSSLRATTLRSLALAATGAVALFGSVALGGSRSNLLSGINSFAHNYVADADIWVSGPGDNQAVNSFSTGVGAARNSRLPSRRRATQRAAAYRSPRAHRLPARRRFGADVPRRLHPTGQPPRMGDRASARRRAPRARKPDPGRQRRDRARAPRAGRLDRRLRADRRRTPRWTGRHARAGRPQRPAALQDRRHDHQPCLAAWRRLHERRRLQPRLGHLGPDGARRAAAPGRERRDGARRDRNGARTGERPGSFARGHARRADRRAGKRRAGPAARDLDDAAAGRDRGDGRRLGVEHMATTLRPGRPAPVRGHLRQPAGHPLDRSDADAERRLPDRSPGRRLRPGRDRRLPASRDRLSACEPDGRRAAA